MRPLVRVIQGQLRGVIEKSIRGKRYAAFKGIPYAKPPTGELRFKDPVPAEPWSNVKDASKFGFNCAQHDPVTRTVVGSDDCLYLNVYTPSDEALQSSPKPVMVWIHGGSFAYGSGDDTIYGPDYIVDKDIVLVTINYRLNIFGFLNLEDEEITGNQGLKDQILALKWVQKNICNFGGDPNNVTIFGESAGGASVHYLTLSPLGKGLFHKAISQSGVAINPWASTIGSPKLLAQKLVQGFGKDISDSKLLLKFLRSVEAKELALMEKRITAEISQTALRCFTPSIDAKSKNPFLPIPVEIASQQGVKVPYMIGHTSHEGIIYLSGVTLEKLQMYYDDLEIVLRPALMELVHNKGLKVSDIKKIYFGSESVTSKIRDNYMKMHSDLQFISGIHEIAEIQGKINESPTYLYKFSYDNGKSLVKASLGLDMPGVCHADDLYFIFYPKALELLGVPPVAEDSSDGFVIERVTQMWTNFAKTGNPTPALSDTLPVKWEPLENSGNLKCLNIGESLSMQSIINVNDRLKTSRSKL